jgi:hypothetical protein
VASPLRQRDFGILFAGRVVDALGDAVAPAALALAVVTATRSSGPATAGALIFTVGAGWAFVLDAATFGVSAGTLAVIHVRYVPAPGGPLPRQLAAVQQEIPADVLARVSAYDWLVSLGAQLLGFAVGPLLTQVAGFTWPLSAAAALVVITLLVPASLPSVRGLRPKLIGC